MNTIDVSTLYRRLSAPGGGWPEREWALFDVREMGECQKGHIEGATFLPRRLLEFRLPELLSVPATPIVVYDSGETNDGRARHAAQTMAANGYAEVVVLDGGAAAWSGAGHELITGWNVPSKDFGERVLVTSDVPYLTPDELSARLDAGADICAFDVRTPNEYREGSLPISVCAPSFEWALHAVDFSNKHDGIVIHCAGRTRSIIGAATARLLGIDNFWALENGTMGWRLAELDLAKAQDRDLGEPSPASRAAATKKARELANEVGAGFMACEELKQRLDHRRTKPLYVFDARDADGYAEGHIEHSIWLPGGQACQRADDFAAVPGATIVFVDDNDARAALSAYWFKRMGFPDVSVLEGGIPAWQQAGLPLERGRGRPKPLGIDAARAKTVPVSAADLAELFASARPPAVIDVGSSRHIKQGHIRGAKWIPRGSLEDRIAAAVKPTDSIVVAARDPDQAIFAAATLVDLGYGNVRRLADSGDAWGDVLNVETGLPEGAQPSADTLAIPYLRDKQSMLDYLEWEEKLGEKHRGAAEQPTNQ